MPMPWSRRPDCGRQRHRRGAFNRSAQVPERGFALGLARMLQDPSSAPAAVHPRTGSEKRMQHVLALN